MSQETRFSSSKKIFKHKEEEVPTRLQSIIFPKPELLTPTKKKFLPNTLNTRVPKLVLRRKSSELASERPRSSSLTEIQHSLSSKVLMSHQQQDPRTVMQRTLKKPPSKVAFGLTPEEKFIKNIEETQKKERTENSWLKMDLDQYPPITLPFFSNPAENEARIKENNLLLNPETLDINDKLMIVQLPDTLPCEGNGNIGKLKVYKSGKMEMTIGSQVFQVFQGVQSTFYQEFAMVTNQNLLVLGPVSSQIIIAPKLI
jgi:RNA polymerase III RPC4